MVSHLKKGMKAQPLLLFDEDFTPTLKYSSDTKGVLD